MWNAKLDEVQAGIKISRRNTNNLIYTDDTTLMAESEEEPKSLLMKVKEDIEKVGLKLNIQKKKIMASSPITAWQIDIETEELERLLMKVKEESEKAGLKLNIQNTKIMASGPITSWQIDRETVGAVTDFISLGSKMLLQPWN